MVCINSFTRSAILASVAWFSLQQSSFCNALSATTKTKTSQPILTHSTEDSPVQFDTACVANPVIVPPDEFSDEWQCYYYGNNGSWNHGLKNFLPTGSTGLAISDDGGITWTKVVGKEKDGAVLCPSDSGWDCVHVGANEVFRVSKDEMHMFYFGADDEEVSVGPIKDIKGLFMRIGRAKSFDNGRTWKKDEKFVLDYDKSEGFFASWPRIVRFDDGRPWKMTYHSFNGIKWRVFGAESTDQGDTWTRTGLLLEGAASEEAFDFKGIGTRAVIPRGDDLLMIFEGVCTNGTHRLGAAINKGSKSNEWTKLNDGMAILEPNKGPFGDWCSGTIGTPFVVDMPDGSLRLYHCGIKPGAEQKMAIGVVESKSGDVSPDSWTALP